MAAIGIRELKAGASDIIRRSQRGELFLVTHRGRPVSVLLPLNEDVEDLILREAPRFVRMRERARRELALGKTVRWAKLKKAVSAASSRRAVARRPR